MESGSESSESIRSQLSAYIIPILLTTVLHSGEHVGRCINIYAMAWAHAIINIALDLWMLALPASQVWGLKMPFRRKLGVMVMFGLGIL